MTDKKKDSYADAGVNLRNAEKAVESYKGAIESTRRPGVIGGHGGFGALFSLANAGYSHEAILVSSTDGVGTKLELAVEMGKHDTIGQDLVAMCANDIATSGATPLFFLDYLATGELDILQAKTIVEGIAAACKTIDCALVGGESAEMPGFYRDGRYDLAGFCVGAVEPEKHISPKKIRGNEKIVGFSSSGFHSNGFSLIRKILQDEGLSLEASFKNSTLGETLLHPTLLYSNLIHSMMGELDIKGLAHITGGSFETNFPRILPENIEARIFKDSWDTPEIISYICDLGKIEEGERYRVFNMGIGLVGVFDENEVESAISISRKFGISAFEIGYLSESDEGSKVLIS